MDIEFKDLAFNKLRGEAHTQDPFNDLIMEMIQMFLNYMNTMDDSELSEFHKMSRNINSICTAVGENPVNYGEKLLEMYKIFHGLKD